MNWFRDLKTAHKLGLGFSLCLLMASAVGGVAVLRMAQLNGLTQAIVMDTMDGTERVSILNDTLRQTRLFEFQHVNAHTAAEKKSEEDQMSEEKTSSNETLAEYAANADTPTERAKLDTLISVWRAYLAMDQTALALSRGHHEDQALKMLNGPMADQFKTASSSLDALYDWNHAQGQVRNADSLRTYSTGRLLVLGFCSAPSCSARRRAF